ncbi:hypothetical protein D3C73_531490 [compost metagenome]
MIRRLGYDNQGADGRDWASLFSLKRVQYTRDNHRNWLSFFTFSRNDGVNALAPLLAPVLPHIAADLPDVDRVVDDCLNGDAGKEIPRLGPIDLTAHMNPNTNINCC